jgi:hypothetical protein
MSAPSGIAQLRKTSDQNIEQVSADAMNLDEFIFSDNISTPAGFSPSPELEKKDHPRTSNSVASAIPIKMRKETVAAFVPQSVPVNQHGIRGNDEFDYVQRHVRKTSIDERRVSNFLFWRICYHFAFSKPPEDLSLIMRNCSPRNGRPISLLMSLLWLAL